MHFGTKMNFSFLGYSVYLNRETQKTDRKKKIIMEIDFSSRFKPFLNTIRKKINTRAGWEVGEVIQIPNNSLFRVINMI